MGPLVSVIVPVYNVENYLERCLTSLLNQSLTNIEIILVNDGSKDNSLRVCEKFAKEDKRIIVLNQSNKGVSSARNMGIKKSSGRFIAFVDPDDWVEINMFEKMFNALEDSMLDIAICDYKLIWSNEKTKNIKLKLANNKLSRDKVIKEVISNMLAPISLTDNSDYIMGSICRILIRREVIEKNNLYFEPDIRLMEDLIFTVKTLLNANGLVYVEGYLYNYFQRASSAVNNYRKNYFEESLKVYNILKNIITINGMAKIYENRMINRYIIMVTSSMRNIMLKGNPNSFFEKENAIKNILIKSEIKKYIQKIDYSDFKFNKKFIYTSLTNTSVRRLAIYYYLISSIKR